MPIIIEPLPQLCETNVNLLSLRSLTLNSGTSAGDDWLFKGSLLVTVTKLIEAIKEQSETLGNVIVPLVRESLTPIVRLAILSYHSHLLTLLSPLHILMTMG